MCMGSLEQGGELGAALLWTDALFSILLFLTQPLTPHTTRVISLAGGLAIVS